jgi:hypothetical protein
MTGHTIICGFGELGSAAAEAYTEDCQVVVVEKDGFSRIPKQLQKVVAVIEGDATDSSILVDAGIHQASRLIVCCGEDDLNADIAKAAVEAAKFRSQRNRVFRTILKIFKWGTGDQEPLSIHVHIDSPRLLDRLRPYSLTMSEADLHLNFFNIGELAADKIAKDSQISPTIQRLPGGYDIALVGWNWLTESILEQLSIKALGSSQKLKIHLLAPSAKSFLEDFWEHHAGLKDAVELHSTDMNLDHLESGIGNHLFEMGPLFSEAIVCLPNDVHSMTVALSICERSAGFPLSPKVSACIYGRSGIAEMVAVNPHFKNLVVVDAVEIMRKSTALVTDVIESMAVGIHEHYCIDSENAGKVYSVPWEYLPLERKMDNREQAIGVFKGLQNWGWEVVPKRNWESEESIHLSLDESMDLARREHERWMQNKLNAGWMYGETTDPDSIPPTNEFLLDWERLSNKARFKNVETVKNWSDTLTKTGFRLVRTKKDTSF